MSGDVSGARKLAFRFAECCTTDASTRSITKRDHQAFSTIRCKAVRDAQAGSGCDSTPFFDAQIQPSRKMRSLEGLLLSELNGTGGPLSSTRPAAASHCLLASYWRSSAEQPRDPSRRSHLTPLMLHERVDQVEAERTA